MIVAANRTALARAERGKLREWGCDRLVAAVIDHYLTTHPDLKQRIDDLILGGGHGGDARMAIASSSLSEQVSGMTVQRGELSGMEALMVAHAKIGSGLAEVVLAGSVSNQMYSSTRTPMPFPDKVLIERDPAWYLVPGLAAEDMSEKLKITRSEQESYAAASLDKALALREEMGGGESCVELRWSSQYPNPQGPHGVQPIDQVLSRDEISLTDPKRVEWSKLPPIYKKNGTITSATRAPNVDGAMLMLMMNGALAGELGHQPLGRMHACMTQSSHPTRFHGCVQQAVKRALESSGLTHADIALYQIAEPYSVTAIATLRGLELDPAKVNVSGGCLAMGHSPELSGVLLAGRLLNDLVRHNGRYGMLLLTASNGTAMAVIFEAFAKDASA